MVHPPLTNIQAELLKVFSRQIPDEDLVELRRVMATFLLQKARQRADAVWQVKGHTDSTFDQLLNDNG